MSSEGAPGPPMRGSDVPVQNDKITQLQAELAEAKRKIEAVEASIQTAQSKVDRKGASEKVQESLYKAIAADKQTRATLEAKAFKLEGKIDDALNQAASGGKPPQQDASGGDGADDGFGKPRFRTFGESFPKLILSSSNSGSSIPSAKDHQHVDVTVRSFGLVTLDSFALIKDKECGLGPLQKDGSLKYHTEADVVRFVTNLLEIASDILQLDVRPAQELSVMSVRADIWILTRFDIPVGAIEVKKPDTKHAGVMEHGRVLGELYDQLLRLECFYGKKMGIGILITGRQVRVCWRGTDDNVNAEDTVTLVVGGKHILRDVPGTPRRGASVPLSPKTPEPGASGGAGGDADNHSPPSISPSKLRPRLHGLYPVEETADDENDHVATAATGEAERHMLATEVVQCQDNPDAMRLILSALVKMTKTGWQPLDHAFANLESRQLICFVKDAPSVFWSRDLATTKPKWDAIKPLRTKYLYAVEDLGHGSNGRVWLTSTIGGYIHVLKIPRTYKNDALERECDWWHRIYPEFAEYVATETWSGHRMLRMPHFAAIIQSERMQYLNAVKDCLREKFEQKGFRHLDVTWRNIGLYKSKKVVRAVMFDLDVRSLETSDEGWIKKCMKHLRESA
eukprot:m.148132 g.148132  ORF g.148132 m.148132 type:complete len:624 (-) comp11666_c0_seq31:180-2051(-)